MTDLGHTPPNDSPLSTASLSVDANPTPPTEYPSIRFNGEQAEKAGLTKCAHGDEYEITIRVRATKIGGDKYDMKQSGGKPPIEFDVIAADAPSKVTDYEEDEEAKPKAPKGIKTPKDMGMETEEEDTEDEEED